MVEAFAVLSESIVYHGQGKCKNVFQSQFKIQINRKKVEYDHDIQSKLIVCLKRNFLDTVRDHMTAWKRSGASFYQSLEFII